MGIKVWRPRVHCGTAHFICRCPAAGLNVQGWIADGPIEGESESLTPFILFRHEPFQVILK